MKKWLIPALGAVLGLVLILAEAMFSSPEGSAVVDAAEAVMDTIRTRHDRKVRDQVKEN